MNRILTILLVMMFAGNSFAQTLPEAEKKIKEYLDAISYWRFQYNAEDTSFSHKVTNADSIAFYNEMLRKYLINTSMSLPAMLTQEIEIPGSNDLIVTTAEDKAVRIFSWETYISNIPHNFASVIIYRQGGKRGSATIFFPSPGKDATAGFDKILAVQSSGGKKYYLPVYKKIEPNDKVTKGIIAYDVSDDAKQVNIFLVDDNTAGVIEYSYDYMSNYDFKKMKEVYNVYIKGKKLYVPVPDKDNQLKGDMKVYNFDGSKFVYDKTE